MERRPRRPYGAVLAAAGLLLLSSIPGAAAATVSLEDHPRPTWQTNGRVRTIVTVGDIAYFGGHFTELRPPEGVAGDPIPRRYAAAIDLNTGKPTSWNPDLNGKVWAISASPDGGTVYVGGDFTAVGGLTRKKIAAIDASSGQPTSWAPRASQGVRALLASPDGTRLYVGGRFTRISGQRQPLLAALSTSTGKLISGWRPTVEQVPDEPCPPRCTPEVASLELSADGSRLYFGGHFGLVNGAARNNAAAVTVADAATSTWDPNVFVADPNNPNQRNMVHGISASPADTPYASRVFICGDFWSVSGKKSPNLAAVHATSGVKDDGWVATTDGGTPACDLHDDGNLYIGGHFQKAGGAVAKDDGVDRLHIASIDASTAEVTPWDPGANSVLGLHELYALGFSEAAGLVAGGDFTKIGKRKQQGFAVFDYLAGAGDTTETSGAEYTFSGTGSSDGDSWFVHKFPVEATGLLSAVLDWDDPAADVNLFLRDPSGTTVAWDNGDAKPKELTHTVEELGTWNVAVKIKSGSATYIVTVRTP